MHVLKRVLNSLCACGRHRRTDFRDKIDLCFSKWHSNRLPETLKAPGLVGLRAGHKALTCARRRRSEHTKPRISGPGLPRCRCSGTKSRSLQGQSFDFLALEKRAPVSRPMLIPVIDTKGTVLVSLVNSFGNPHFLPQMHSSMRNARQPMALGATSVVFFASMLGGGGADGFSSAQLLICA